MRISALRAALVGVGLAAAVSALAASAGPAASGVAGSATPAARPAPAQALEEVPLVEAAPAVFHPLAPRRALEAAAPDLVRAQSRLPDGARHALPPPSSAERAAAARRARSGEARRKSGALRVGVSRTLPEAVALAGIAQPPAAGESRLFSGGLLERAPGGAIVWSAEFTSEGATAVRLHFREATLPAGARVWVYAANGQTRGPYAFEGGIRPEGFWTHTILGPTVALEVRIPAGEPAGLRAARLTVDAVVHLDRAPGALAPAGAPAEVRPKSDACFVDATCVATSEFAGIADLSAAAAQLNFVDGGEAFICSGGLLAATNGANVPYLLTANHCFDNQPAATSLEAFFQFKTATCNGPAPVEDLFPSTLGSTLLATGKTSDFTFLQLSEDPPDNSVFLGWTTDDIAHAGGTMLHRVSYPNARPQIYTREQVDSNPVITCEDTVLGNFIYETDVHGGTGGGSSGSTLVRDDLRAVGQELGACGSNTDDDCDVVDNRTIDGAFRVTFPSVQQWLSPFAPGPCVPGATTLCLNAGRFRVTVNWASSSGTNGAGNAVPLTDDSGYFWFFNAANIELVVKVLNACALNPARFWVFAGGLTNVDVTMNVQDTQTGVVRTYHNTLGTAFPPLQDTSAFVCP